MRSAPDEYTPPFAAVGRKAWTAAQGPGATVTVNFTAFGVGEALAGNAISPTLIKVVTPIRTIRLSWLTCDIVLHPARC